MSVAPPPLPAIAVHARRCVRHTTREAAARCPRCAEFFCRECVVEHDGKLLCAPCLAKTTGRSATRAARFAALRGGVRAAAGLAALWLAFYWFGALLLKMPPAFHDGTIWKRAAEAAAP
ncbi:MAG: hypothetical protein RLZZ15_4194 [Verrucomicrobiota bacterium]|jgi:hypothetical protein